MRALRQEKKLKHWSYLASLKKLLDEYGLERVYAWGHPDGLEGGTNKEAYDDMIASIERAKAIGADVMRVVGSSLKFRKQPHEPQITRLSQMFSEAVQIAEKYGIRMAVENHIDFTADEMLQLLTTVSSPYLGINFDTGNFLRLLDDPIKGMEKLAKYVYATHIKDLKPQKVSRQTSGTSSRDAGRGWYCRQLALGEITLPSGIPRVPRGRNRLPASRLPRG